MLGDWEKEEYENGRVLKQYTEKEKKRKHNKTKHACTNKIKQEIVNEIYSPFRNF